MATTYITDADLQVVVASRLNSTWDKIVSNAPNFVDIVHDANQDAYYEIRTKLINRGFTAAIIDTWDRRIEFNRKVALCFALREGGVIREVATDMIDRVCECLEQLDEIPIMVSDIEQFPTTSGRISYGDLTRPDEDVFSIDMDT